LWKAGGGESAIGDALALTEESDDLIRGLSMNGTENWDRLRY